MHRIPLQRLPNTADSPPGGHHASDAHAIQCCADRRVDVAQVQDGGAQEARQRLRRVHERHKAGTRLRVALVRLGGRKGQGACRCRYLGADSCGGAGLDGVAQRSACQGVSAPGLQYGFRVPLQVIGCGYWKERPTSLQLHCITQPTHSYSGDGQGKQPTCAVERQHAQVRGAELSRTKSSPDHCLLRGAVWRGQAAAATVLVHRRTKQHRLRPRC